jgi:hypothetical protein
MASGTYYAWSPIKGGTAEKPVTVDRGDKVSQSDLGVDDANWAALVESGAVRDKEFPAPADYEGSVIDYLRDKLAEAQAASGAVEEEEASSQLAAVAAAAEPSVAPEPATSSSSSSSGKK